MISLVLSAVLLLAVLAGSSRGSVISKNTRSGEAPKSSAASARLLSMPTSLAFTSI